MPCLQSRPSLSSPPPPLPQPSSSSSSSPPPSPSPSPSPQSLAHKKSYHIGSIQKSVLTCVIYRGCTSTVRTDCSFLIQGAQNKLYIFILLSKCGLWNFAGVLFSMWVISRSYSYATRTHTHIYTFPQGYLRVRRKSIIPGEKCK